MSATTTRETMPVVGIIMRTKNRPVLLRRALDSVTQQTYAHWHLVVVNDGGDPGPVKQLAKQHDDYPAGRISIVHNEQSLGMEAASNCGIDATDAPLLIIHDDDDSWAPDFLDIMVHQLQHRQQQLASVAGVACYSNRVVESITNNIVETKYMAPFNNWAPAGVISFDRILYENFIPPISFLFTRRAMDTIGSFDEDLPVLGDWDFIVRFLSHFDVYLIPQFLAFYHHRTSTTTGVNGNSITAGLDKHIHYRQILLNRWLRNDLHNGAFGIGSYANLRDHIGKLQPATALTPANLSLRPRSGQQLRRWLSYTIRIPWLFITSGYKGHMLARFNQVRKEAGLRPALARTVRWYRRNHNSQP